MDTKGRYAEEVILGLSADPVTRDFKIDQREIFLRLDAIVNSLAKQSSLANWQAGWGGVDEQFLTTWGLNDDAVTVIDPDADTASYFMLPVGYADLPRNGGIHQIVPMQNAEVSVIIMTFSEYRMYKNTPAGDMQGRLACYPIGNKVIFNKAMVKQDYGDMMLRLVVRDSSLIAADAPYPIPADARDIVIKAVVAYFRDKLAQGADLVRDNNNIIPS